MNRARTLLTVAFAFVVLCGREAVDAAATPAAGAPPDTAPAPTEPGQVILIQNATVLTVSHGAIEVQVYPRPWSLSLFMERAPPSASPSKRQKARR